MTTATLKEPLPTAAVAVVADDDLYEIIDGKRVRQPPMGVYAVWLGNILYFHLASYTRTKDLGRAVQEALFHFPPPIGRDRRPDLAFVSYQRWAKTRSVPRRDNAWDVIPNLAVEVVSPTDGAEELHCKIDEYFRAGVELVWVIYPELNQVYVYRSMTEIAGLTVADVLDGGNVVAGFRLPLTELFSEPPETDAVPE